VSGPSPSTEERQIREAALDRTIDASFPASDPPSSIPNPDDHDAVSRDAGTKGKIIANEIQWRVDFDSALSQAWKQHKHVCLIFTIPCVDQLL